MSIFSGKACFSPSVSSHLLDAWVQHGGTLTTDKKDNRRAAYFFCDGLSDPWVSKLAARSIVVRVPICAYIEMIWVQVIHANWVRDAVNQKFPIPVARYVLDDHYSVCNSANFLSSSDSNSDSDSDSDSIRSEQEIASLLADSSSPPAANSTVYLKRDSRKRRTHEFEYVSHRSTSKKSRFADFAQPTAKYEYDDQSGSTLVNPELSSTSTSSNQNQDTKKPLLDLKRPRSNRFDSHANFWARALTSFHDNDPSPLTISIKTILRSIPSSTPDDPHPTLFKPGKIYMGKEMKYLGRDSPKYDDRP